MAQLTILLTGSTDGIGLETAKLLVSKGHLVMLHGRNPSKLAAVSRELSSQTGNGSVESYVADLSRMDEVETLANAVAGKHTSIDVLLNNAGIFHTPDTITEDGLDVRFAVNTIAPYLLTQKLLPRIASDGRVINTSSAAQSPVSLGALTGQIRLDDFEAYAQSKLALNMWSRHLAMQENAPCTIAVNPGSLLGSKMVKEGFGIAGGDIRIGANILARAALEDDFASASGQYFDNDSGRFKPPHPDALDDQKVNNVVQTIQEIVSRLT